MGGPGRLLAQRLCEALENEDYEDVDSLLNLGADPNLILPEGIAPVHLASGKERESALRCLNLILQHGGNPNTRSIEGLTPLHVAASWGCSKCLRLLLKKGGDHTLEDQDGNRAMDLAIEQGNRRCALILQCCDPCNGPTTLNGTFGDGYLEGEDSNDTTELFDIYDGSCSDASPLNSTRMSLQCTLPSRPSQSIQLSDMVIASHSQLPSFVESLPEIMCRSDEAAAVGPQMPPLRTQPSLPVHSDCPSVYPSEQLFGASPSLAHLSVANTVDSSDATNISARELQSVNVSARGIPLSVGDTSAKSDLTSASQNSGNSSTVLSGAFSECNVYAEAHHNTTASTADGEPRKLWEISGVCTLSWSSRGSLSAIVNDADTVLKSRFRDSSLTPEFKRSQGLDVTSPDHVYMFSHETSEACDLEKTVLDPSLTGTRNDARRLYLELHGKDVSSDSDKYDSCHSECYISTDGVSSYDSGHIHHCGESKADIASEAHPNASSLLGRKSVGPNRDPFPGNVMDCDAPVWHSHPGHDFAAQGLHVTFDTSQPVFLLGKESVDGESAEVFSIRFGNQQETQRVCTAPGESVSWNEPQIERNSLVADSASTLSGNKWNSPSPLLNTAPASQDTVPVTCDTATQHASRVTEDIPAADVLNRDSGLSPKELDVCTTLKAMMLSTKKHKFSFLSTHFLMEGAQPGQISNGGLFMGMPDNGGDYQEARSIPKKEMNCETRDILPVDVDLCKNGACLDKRVSKSQRQDPTVDTLEAECCTAQDASPGNESHASLSSELRRMMVATKTVQSPQAQQRERPCYITPRTKIRVTSSTSRNSSSSLFDESLEMPQRGPRIFSPARRYKSPHACAGMTDDRSQEERPLSQDAGIVGQFPESPTKGMEIHSLDDTVIIEENAAPLGTMSCETGVPMTKDDVLHNRSCALILNSQGKGEGGRSGLDQFSQPVILRSQGIGRNGDGPLDDSNPALRLRTQSAGTNGNIFLGDYSATVMLRSQGFLGFESNAPDDSDAPVLLQSQGGGGYGGTAGNAPDATIPTALIKPQSNCNFSDFFTDDKSSSFTDERMPFAVRAANSQNARLISDTDSNVSDNTWMTEDGDHSVAAPRLGRTTLKSRNVELGPSKSGNVCHSTLLYPALCFEEEGSPLRPRYSFSRLSTIRPSDPMPTVSSNSDTLYPFQDLLSLNLTLSPGGRPVSTDMNEPIEYLYMDPEEGHALIERHYPCTDDSTQDSTSSNDTIIYNWTTYKSQLPEPNVKRKKKNKVNGNKISPELYRLSNDDIMAKLREFGENPGPVTSMTRRVYLALLDKLMKDPQAKAPQSDYSPELTMALRNLRIPNCNEDEMILSRQFDQPDKNAKWREGVLKSSFNYLLLDPRVTRNLPCRCLNLSQAECFRTFISAIFYVGKGKRSRPYSHLYEALTHYKTSKTRACPKVQHILDIWQTGLGVVSLHCFQNAIPVEAYTREACMVDAIGIKMLTNQKKGNYYGYSQDWPMKRRRQLGVHMLHRAMQIFLAEGERQLRPADIRIGQ